MKLNKIVAVGTLSAIVIIAAEMKAKPAVSNINMGQSTNIIETLLIENSSDKLPIHLSKSIDLEITNKNSSFCKINQRSIAEDWINLLGRLIIIFSFTSFGVMGNSGLIQRYVKLIFKDVLPVFLVIFLCISLLGITSVIAAISLSSPAPLTISASSSQNNCMLK